ncbi:MAG: SPOR domain-containing protein [Gammaproteobacteria bacterium]
MARDYKHRKRTSRSAARGKGQNSFAAGLAVGLAVALLVHLYHSRGVPLEQAPVRTPASATALPEEPEDSGPVFDFYEILPDFEVVVPGPSAGSDAPAQAAREVPPGTYYLQAGSFRQYDDADRRKASLALLGLVSDIRKVTVNDRDHYRVQIGPVSDPAALRRMQQQLSGAGIEYLALRAKEPAR